MEVKLQETHEFTLLNRCFYNQDELLTKLGGNSAGKKTHDVPKFERSGGSADEAIVNL